MSEIRSAKCWCKIDMIIAQNKECYHVEETERKTKIKKETQPELGYDKSKCFNLNFKLKLKVQSKSESEQKRVSNNYNTHGPKK